MRKNYYIISRDVPAQPRSKRLRSSAASSGSSTSVIVQAWGEATAADPNSHTHANKAYLDQITTDQDDYLYLTQPHVAGDNASIETNKVKAGYADRAYELTEDSPTREDFLSRKHDDTALGRITFKEEAVAEKGVQFGSAFVGGMQGVGGRIDAGANAELESMRLRSWLEVPEIRFNRAEVILGDQWASAGGGIVERVQPDYDQQGNRLGTGVAWLKLEDGEIGAIAEGDICKGYFHDFGNPANNAAADSTKEEESLGNKRMAGFATVFFRIEEVMSAEGGVNNVFRYAIRGVSERWPWQCHPYEGMHFVCYGSFTNEERQTSKYTTRTYERYLVGVHEWEFTQDNIAAQFGDLSNLSVFGLEMSGYSAYLNNIYMSGTIKQFDAVVPYTLEVTTNTGDTFIADGELLDLACIVKQGFYDRTADAQSWSITRDSGNAQSDADWNAAHTSFAGNITLSQSDIGNDIYSANSLFTITADGDGWSVSRTIVVRTLSIGSRRTMRFVSEYGEFDTFIGYGDTVHFHAIIEDALRNDYTAEYTGWTIRRHNGDTPDDVACDGIWNATKANISNDGDFYITWSALQDDLQAERATFIIEAQLASNQSISVTGNLTI